MRQTFEDLATELDALLEPGEAFTASLAAEDSDFLRLSGNRVRQAGQVTQARLHVDLIREDRHIEATVSLARDPAIDRSRLRTLVPQLRQTLPLVPEDPYLPRVLDAATSEDLRPGRLPEPAEVLARLAEVAEGLDLAGHWAAGRLYRGAAGSSGQAHWFETDSFNFDWSLHHASGRAVKGRYAGRDWSAQAFAARIDTTRDQLAIVARPPRRLAPGTFRAFLAPAALAEILGVILENGFGMRAHRTRQTPLLHLADGATRLHPQVTLSEHAAGGQAPRFTAQGLWLPPRITLIDAGRFSTCLADARSGREYAVPVNAAREGPQSLEMEPGALALGTAAAQVGEGLLIADLWYTNRSDPGQCGITGMTRYACLWVEDGQVRAPVEPMRFDVSLYHLLGAGLLGLTRERERLMDPGTYEQRSTRSACLPGVLVCGFPLTL